MIQRFLMIWGLLKLPLQLRRKNFTAIAEKVDDEFVKRC